MSASFAFYSEDGHFCKNGCEIFTIMWFDDSRGETYVQIELHIHFPYLGKFVVLGEFPFFREAEKAHTVSLLR
jgi:hypothetical protein